MAEQRMAIVGAGANGASIGADLIEAGHDVTLVEQWPAHVEKMRSEGLRILTSEREVLVRPKAIHLCEVAELRSSFDVVLIVMKAYDAGWSAQLIAPRLAADGLIVGVQNGMTADAVAAAASPERTLGAVIECSATMSEPGVVHRHTDVDRSWFGVGALPGGPLDRVAELETVLRHSGTVVRFDDIRSAKWMKLVSNCTLLVTSAILGLPMLDALHAPGFRAVMIAAGQEAMAVGIAAGYRVLPIFGLTEEQVADPGTVVDVMTDRLFADFVVPGATTTVLQDWRRGRHSEVDDLNGHAAAEGRRVGVATPVNDVVVELAHAIESGHLAPDRENLAHLTAALPA